MKQQKTRLSFDIPAEFRAQIREQAQRFGMTSAQYCRMVLMQAVGGGSRGGQK